MRKNPPWQELACFCAPLQCLYFLGFIMIILKNHIFRACVWVCGCYNITIRVHIVLRFSRKLLEVCARRGELLPTQERGRVMGKGCFRVPRHCASVVAFMPKIGTHPKRLLLVLKRGCYFLAGIKLCRCLVVCDTCQISRL